MSRHAGFAAAATITEARANDAILSYVRGLLGPFLLPLPPVINVGPVPVVLAGLIELRPPTLELHSHPDDLVTVHFTFTSILTAQIGQQPPGQWTVEWTGAVQTGLVTGIVDDQVVLGIDTASVQFQPLTVTVLSGPAPPASLLTALQSQLIASSATAFVQSLPPVTIAPPLLRANLTVTQGLDIPITFDPDWFTVTLNATRIVARPLEGCITVAIDVDGLWVLDGASLVPAPPGDQTALVDLTKSPGAGISYSYTLTPDADVEVGPVLSGKPATAGGDIAAVVNMALIQSVVSQVSPQIFDTQIRSNVSLMSITAAGFTKFDKPLRGIDDALALDFHVQVQEGPWFGVDGRLLLQPYLQTADGPTEFVYQYPDQWRIHCGKVELDLPWWAEIAVVGLTVYFSAGIPLLTPVFAMAGVSLLDGVLPGLLASAESRAAKGVNSGANAIAFPAPWAAPLPGLAAPDWTGAIRSVSVSPEGIDVAVNTMPPPGFATTARGVISPAVAQVVDRQPVRTSLQLREDLARLDGITLAWTVRRADTQQVVVTGTTQYDDPGGNGVDIPHHSPALYHVDAFEVSCTASVLVGGQPGVIFSGSRTVTMWDNVDRHHPFVEWGPHDVHFENEGTGHEWWTHTRRSRIHRTAVSARCAMLRQTASQRGLTAATATPHWLGLVHYLDALPFSWQTLEAHRKPLCEYCFFGGPDRHVPRPQADWF